MFVLKILYILKCINNTSENETYYVRPEKDFDHFPSNAQTQ